MSPVEYFFEGFLNFSLPSSREKLIWSFYLLLWKHLLILIIFPKAASNFCSGFLLLLLVDFFDVHSRLSEQFSVSHEFIFSFQTNFQASHRTTFRDKSCWQKAQSPEQSLKRDTRRNFTISNWFHRSNSSYNMVFLHKKTTNLWSCTVGAQSIAPAQSIAHGQIGDSISQKI